MIRVGGKGVEVKYETPFGKSRAYNTMAITFIPRPSPPGGSPSLWLKNFKSQRVDLETPWVSTGIWWVSIFCLGFAMGFHRVSSWPPWVSTGILAFVFVCCCFCYGFPQVCVHVAFASCLGFHRFGCETLMDLFHGYLQFASQHA